MYLAPPNNFIYCSYKVTVKFADDLGNSHLCRGTGFFLAAGGSAVFVTNRHVLDPKYKKKNVQESMRLIEIRILGKTHQGETYELIVDSKQLALYPDSNEDDVACIINPQCQSTKETTEIFYHFGVEDLADEYLFSEGLHPGDQIFYAGFPDPYDKLAQRPLLRSGSIASDPRYAYSHSGADEGARIAYEGFSSGGASGSPIWAAARGAPNARNGSVIGVNAGHIDQKFGSHSGISFFYKSTVIHALLRKHALIEKTL